MLGNDTTTTFASDGIFNFDRQVVFLKIIPGICIPFGALDIFLNGFMMFILVQIRFWRSPIDITYFTMIFMNILSSGVAVGIYCLRLKQNAIYYVIPQHLENTLYIIELYVVWCFLVVNLLLVSLRLTALLLPFVFRFNITNTFVLPFIVFGLITAGIMVFVDSTYFFDKNHWIQWVVFLCLHFITLILAFSSLLPLHRREDARRATFTIVILSLINFLCYGTFGGFNLGTEIICGGNINYSLWILNLFCNIDTFYSLIFVFPVCNSFATAIVISRGARLKFQIREVGATLKVKLAELHSRMSTRGSTMTINNSTYNSDIHNIPQRSDDD